MISIPQCASTFFFSLSGCFCALAWNQEVVLSPTATSYSMAQLSGSTLYNVKLQAIAGAQRSRPISTAFTTSEGHRQAGVLCSSLAACSEREGWK